MVFRKSTKYISWVFKFLLLLSLQTFAWVLISLLSRGVIISTFLGAVLMAITLSLLNAFLWPFISRVTLKFSVFTFGIFNIFLSAIFVIFAADLVPGVSIAGLWSGVLAVFLLTVINTFYSTTLSFFNEGVFYKQAFSRKLKFKGKTHKPGLIFIEIDGLSKPTLLKAINLGYAPFLKGLILNGDYNLKLWETDYSCQTGASQIGILHGNNKNIPAFRWVDKKTGNIVSSSSTNNVRGLEKLHSNKKGLLYKNGGSRSNMYSGDAKDTVFTSSTVGNLRLVRSDNFYAFFSNPYNMIRTVVLFFWELVIEFFSFYSQQVKNVTPRLDVNKRGGVYPFVRGFTNVVLREITVFTLINDIFEGKKDVIYATFFGYDELAHHSGVEDKDTLEHLRKIDNDLQKLSNLSYKAERKYNFVYLSDHGQSKGATFKQRFGLTLQDLVVENLNKNVKVSGNLETNETSGVIDTFKKNVLKDENKYIAKIIKKINNSKYIKEIEHEKNDEETEVTVLASGNLGLIYFNKYKKRLTLEEINKYYPRLINTLIKHKGIGFVSLNTKKHGFIALGRDGKYLLEQNKVIGKNPLKDFRNNLPKHLIRSNKFKNAPDIYVNSKYYKTQDEVAAFEELIGNHGGAGGNQWKAFVCFPKEFEYPKQRIVGAENLHKQLKRWAYT